jgi:WD40 repeat protein
LRQRLEKRGLMLPAVLGGSLLIAESTSAVPPVLAESTLNAVQTGAGATPAASTLAREVLRTMFFNRVKGFVAVVLLAVTGSGLGLLGLRLVAREAPAGTVVAPGAERSVAASAPPPEKGKDLHGDPLPAGVVMRLGTLRQRAVGAVLAISPDGRSLIGVRSGKSILIWDAATGELRQKRELPGEAWSSVQLSPDGRWLLRTTGGGEEHLEIWDVQTGAKARDLKIKGSRYIMPVAFSADGKRVAAVGHRRVGDNKPSNPDNHLVRAWDLATGKEIFAIDVQNNVSTSLLAFTPDGKRLLATFSSIEEGMYCWEIATGRRLWQNKEFGHTGIVFTPDGKILSSQQRPRVVDMETGQKTDIPGLPAFEWDTHLHLTPDGRTLLLANHQGVRVWDLKAGKELRMLSGAGEQVVVMPDGRSIITNSGVLQRWDLATGKPLWTDTSGLGHIGEVTVVAFSADGKRLVSASNDGSVRLWDATTGQPLRVWRGHEGKRPIRVWRFADAGVKTLDISADGRRVVSAGSDECIKLWDVTSDKELRTIALPDRENGEAERHVYQVRISPDGTRVFGFFGPRGGFAVVGQPAPKLTDKLATWDAGTGELLEIHPVEMGGSGILSRDGGTLLTQGILRDVRSSREIARLPDAGRGESVAFSRDGALVIGGSVKETQKNGMTYVSSDGLRVWEVATGKVVARLKTKSWVAQTAFHPDNRIIVTNDLDGIHLRDVRNGEVVGRFKMPEAIRAGTTPGSYAGCLTFTPDGRRMATGHPDSTILLWDVRLPADIVEPLTAKELEGLWADLAGDDAAKAWEAVWRLAEAPKDAMGFLRSRIQPYPTVPADETRRLLAALDDPAFSRRDAATKRLRELGLKAEPVLRAALRGKLTLEPKRRIEGLLAELAKAPQPLAAEELRQLRGLIVLECIGTAEARRVLEAVANGPESARLTRQARAALAAMR